jgi:MFS family permease
MIDPSRVEQALAEIEHSHKQKAQGSELREFLSGRYRWPILLAFLFAFFNQVSGINAVIYYAPRIFSMAGMESSAALLSSAGLGLVNLVFTLIGLALIDRFGRRFLMYIGSFGYILSLTSLALIFHLEAFGGSLVPLLIFVFIASHAIGQGACIWVFIAEIFPNSVRGYGMSLGSGTHWVFAALVAFSFPYFAGTLGGAPLFAFFAVMMVLQLLFVRYLMPETKGVSLEDLEVQLSQKR